MRLARAAFAIAMLTAGAGYFNKDRLPGPRKLMGELSREPRQSPVSMAPFQVRQGGLTYTINPLYEYELYGLVVSYHHSRSWFDYYHDQWKDYLNLKDICVIWGPNAAPGVYDKIRFSSGSWTCYFQTDDASAWAAFSPAAASNNHLLSDGEAQSRAILDARIGDQIYMKGYLARYSHNQGFQRGTSVTRNDTGNGACETVYVTDFRVVKPANRIWHALYGIGKSLFAASVFIWIYDFFRRPTGLV